MLLPLSVSNFYILTSSWLLNFNSLLLYYVALFITDIVQYFKIQKKIRNPDLMSILAHYQHICVERNIYIVFHNIRTSTALDDS